MLQQIVNRSKKTQSYKELIVWQKSMELVYLIYKLTGDFPKSELFSLVDQIRRAVISIPSNIAEGWGRRRVLEYIHFLQIASGSSSELETQLIIAKRLSFGKLSDYKRIDELLLEVQKLLYVIIRKLKS